MTTHTATTKLVREVVITAPKQGVGASIVVDGRDLAPMVRAARITMGARDVTRVELECYAGVEFTGSAEVGFEFEVKYPDRGSLIYHEPNALRALASGLRRLADDVDRMALR